MKRSSGKSKVESAETINRLTKSLEESQKRCRDLLETGILFICIYTSFLVHFHFLDPVAWLIMPRRNEKLNKDNDEIIYFAMQRL